MSCAAGNSPFPMAMDSALSMNPVLVAYAVPFFSRISAMGVRSARRKLPKVGVSVRLLSM